MQNIDGEKRGIPSQDLSGGKNFKQFTLYIENPPNIHPMGERLIDKYWISDLHQSWDFFLFSYLKTDR